LKRLALTLTLVALVAGVAAMPGSAASFDDSSPCPADGPLLVCPTMQIGQSVHLQLVARNGCDVYRWEYVNGALPQGLSMSSSGLITGTPTRAETTRPWMIVHDLLASEGGPSWCGGDNHSERQFVFTVVGSSGTPTPPPPPTPAPTPAPQPPLAITSSGLQKATVGTPYTATLAASGAGSFSWTLATGVLPAGLTLSVDGVLAGTPTAAGSYTFTVRAASGGRSVTKQFELIVVDKLTVSGPADQTWEVRRPLTIAISAHGGTPGYRWAISGTLPEDTGFIDYEGDGTTSYVKGVPAQAGSFRLGVTVTDSTGKSAQLNVTLTVAPKLQITTFDLGRAHRGKPYRLMLTTIGGVGPTSWALVSGSLPPGLTLDTATGAISGKPRARGHFLFALVVTDALGAKRAMRYSLTVARR
jgi:hypothetical protein